MNKLTASKKQIIIISALALGVFATILIGIAVSSQSKTNAINSSAFEIPAISKVPLPVNNNTVKPEAETLSSAFPMYINPLTGIALEAPITGRRPMVVMFDNYHKARPQAGIEQADIVYEILAEGQITRYMAVYYGELPEDIGPIRSARPYFVEVALGYNPYYVHVGGSNDAFKLIRESGIADIDGVSSNPFWRKNHKVAPHNLYSSYEALIGEANRRQFADTFEPHFVDFNREFTLLNGVEAQEIEFAYKPVSASDKIGYYSSYKYNNEDFRYYRYTNGVAQIDESSSNPIACTNIIVQYADTVVLDSEGRLKVDVIGSGNGNYYSGGQGIPITWTKKTMDHQTEFFTKEGLPLALNPGKTWIQIMKTGTEETIK